VTNELPQLQNSAVLVPVFRDRDGRLRLLLVRRTDHGIHGGQLAFPGGKRSDTDPSLLHTALRETREEVGIAEDSVEVLSELPMVETASTGFRIYPFLARIQAQDEWQYEEREVAEVIEVTVEHLANPDVHGESMEKFPQYPGPILVRYYEVGTHRLWGASYRIVTPLIPRLLAEEWAI
jgi:8-oxo-dGTP pyrophosphatase MutT (NUDIX family)